MANLIRGTLLSILLAASCLYAENKKQNNEYVVIRSSIPKTVVSFNDSLKQYNEKQAQKIDYSLIRDGEFYEFSVPLQDLIKLTKKDFWGREKSGKSDREGFSHYTSKKAKTDKAKTDNAKKSIDELELRVCIEETNDQLVRFDEIKSYKILKIKRKSGNEAVAEVKWDEGNIMLQYFIKVNSRWQMNSDIK